jgi:hypothetical protein
MCLITPTHAHSLFPAETFLKYRALVNPEHRLLNYIPGADHSPFALYLSSWDAPKTREILSTFDWAVCATTGPSIVTDLNHGHDQPNKPPLIPTSIQHSDEKITLFCVHLRSEFHSCKGHRYLPGTRRDIWDNSTWSIPLRSSCETHDICCYKLYKPEVEGEEHSEYDIASSWSIVDTWPKAFKFSTQCL